MRGMSAPFEIRQLVHASAFYMGRHLVATCAGSLFHVSMVHVYDFYISCMLPPHVYDPWKSPHTKNRRLQGELSACESMLHCRLSCHGSFGQLGIALHCRWAGPKGAHVEFRSCSWPIGWGMCGGGPPHSILTLQGNVEGTGQADPLVPTPSAPLPLCRGGTPCMVCSHTTMANKCRMTTPAAPL